MEKIVRPVARRQQPQRLTASYAKTNWNTHSSKEAVWHTRVLYSPKRKEARFVERHRSVMQEAGVVYELM